MAFKGYLELGGVEIINAERTEAYVRHQNPGFPLHPSRHTAEVHTALEDAPYESPLVDDAPWVNPADPATHRFFGMYPLDISGIGDSTHETTITEGILSGAVIGEPRDASRTIRVKGALIGADELSANAGLAWLKAAVRVSQCGTHDTCDTADLRYFLAAPDVCVPLYGRPITHSESFRRGRLTASTSPNAHNLVELDEPAHVTWTFPYTDGTVIEWGLLPQVGKKALSSSKPTIVRRTNYVPNPSFSDNVDLWDTENTEMTREDEVGSTRHYAHVSGGGDVTTRTNWMINPAFKVNPATTGWRTSGTVTPYTDTTSPVRNATAVFDFSNVALTTSSSVTPGYGEGEYGNDEYLGAAPPAPVAPTWNQGGYGEGVYPGAAGAVDTTPNVAGSGPTSRWAEFTYTGPVARAASVVSVFVAHQIEPIIITVTGPDGAILSQQSQTITETPFQRISFTVPLGRNDIVRLSTPGARLRMAGMQIETGTVLHDYFDGATPDVPGAQVSYAWTGAAELSSSRRVSGLQGATRISTPNMDTPFGSLYASFSVKSELGAQITAQILSISDGTVLAEESFIASPDWRRFSLNTLYGRAVQLVLTSVGAYDLDQVLVESASQLWDFFSGDSAKVAGYKTEWLGAPNHAPSRITYTKPIVLDHDDSRVRPYLSVIQGYLESTTLTVGHRDKIPVDVQLQPVERRYHEVRCTGGPTIIAERHLTNGYVIEVELFVTAEDPYAYSNSVQIPVASAPVTAAYTDVACPVPSLTALIDPDIPVIPPAPRPPAIPAIGFEPISTWRRYWIPIPAANVAAWSQTVPTLELTSKAQAVRQVRVRFHPNPFGFPIKDVDPCSYCAEFIISYLPPNTTLTLNGMSEKAIAAVAGTETQPADHLLYGTDGTPMSWPSLSCSSDYVMTIDIPPTSNLANLDIDLVVNRKE